jgi:hypothetical protein
MELEGQKLKQSNSHLLFASVLCTVLGFLSLCFVVYEWVGRVDTFLVFGYGASLVGIALFIIAMVLGAISCYKCGKYRHVYRLVILVICVSITSTGILIVFILQYPTIHQKELCFIGLRNLSEALHNYVQDYDQYPPADKWCDVLINYAENHPSGYSSYFNRSFTCLKWEEGRSSYAMNPNVHRDSPSNVVWLFDSKEGWNLYGGSELLNLNNHQGNGCNILFSNGQIMFVEKEKLTRLRWK